MTSHVAQVFVTDQEWALVLSDTSSVRSFLAGFWRSTREILERVRGSTGTAATHTDASRSRMEEWSRAGPR
jgi:hypothetical protein